MKRKIIAMSTVVILFCFFILIFMYSKDVANSITFSISIWKDNLLPSLFPFFLLSDLLLEYGFIDFISFMLGKYIVKIFHVPKEAGYAIFISLFSGFPSGSKYVKDLLEKRLINIEEANYLIMFTHYSNPLFIVSTIGILLLNNLRVGYLIFFSHVISNLIIAIIFRRKEKIKYETQSLNSVISKISKEKEKSFISVLMKSVIRSFTTLVNMLGIIMFFLIITTIIQNLFNFNMFFKALSGGFLEMTQGVKYISEMTSLNLVDKASIIGAMISFSGLSVHFQVKSIIDNTGIKYKHFLVARILQAVLCFLMIRLLLFYIL